jgi:hypothetical protein
MLRGSQTELSLLLAEHTNAKRTCVAKQPILLFNPQCGLAWQPDGPGKHQLGAHKYLSYLHNDTIRSFSD